MNGKLVVVIEIGTGDGNFLKGEDELLADARDEELVLVDADHDWAAVPFRKRTGSVDGQVGFGGTEEWLGTGE